MKVVFQTGPGLFAAETQAGNKDIPQGVCRCYCARIEAYDISKSQADNDMSFKLLPAMGDQRKDVAVALLKLRDSLIANSKVLEESANRK